jgi:hypothetical protein
MWRCSEPGRRIPAVRSVSQSTPAPDGRRPAGHRYPRAAGPTRRPGHGPGSDTGRRLMSTSTAVLRMASPIAVAMISLRLRSLRSPHRLVMTSSASKQQPLMACTLHREEIVAHCLVVERQILLPGHSKPRPLDRCELLARATTATISAGSQECLWPSLQAGAPACPRRRAISSDVWAGVPAAAIAPPVLIGAILVLDDDLEVRGEGRLDKGDHPAHSRAEHGRTGPRA